MTKTVVTGSAGFIGSALTKKLLDRGDEVIGIDNINNYYDVNLKLARLAHFQSHPAFTEARIHLEDRAAIDSLFAQHKPQRVVNLAAQAGVRYSLENPYSYVDSNLQGFINILENCRHHEIEHLVFASSSSVYGANTKMPYSTHDNVDHPLSLYAATKKANELMAHSYSHLYRLPTTGLRFFTVYGPWGRPDMALFKFTRNILKNKPIDIYNYGNHQRDFTYIDDIVEGVIRTLDHIPSPDSSWNGNHPNSSSSTAPYRLYNIGNHQPVELLEFIRTLEECLGRTAEKNMLPMQAGDVPATYADVDDLMKDVGFCPATSIQDGITNFVAWYKDYFKI
ncbi:NAD-dependent epimerase [Candidatus Nitrosacidococcus sp. I8]|uniref:NAD-dependent epimerase n=1 Tax=Candidatus Nitrosacidococcus sp. I8 TaxID=2942908 RepID=UPI0022260748|nr:NAD-dependent epimerase [Candidatus Nitrosacidococcus sp. I8]CAH9019434.1 UDP-N-acetylglucosamine 4-epimerase [Candidatus Nitrosacidococcus sp. I8]